VLSVQSSVVRGYVGNKCAVLPLQLHGFDVDPLHSVQLSNHTGYPRVAGHRFGGEHAEAVLAALDSNGLLFFDDDEGGGGGGQGESRKNPAYSHLLTGYVGTADFLRAVAAAARELGCGSGGGGPGGGDGGGSNPSSSTPPQQVEWYCDPVMGDEGKLYVPPELVGVYKKEVVPLAAVLLPNGFELGLLDATGDGDDDEDGGVGSGQAGGQGEATTAAPDPTITSEAAAVGAAARLLRRGPHTVVVTSLPRGAGCSSSPPEDNQTITLLAVTRRPQDRPCELLMTPPPPSSEGAAAAADPKTPQNPRENAEKTQNKVRAWRLRVPRIPGYYTGTGDLLSALLLAHASRTPRDLPAALERAVGALQAVLGDTARHAEAEAEAEAEGGQGADAGDDADDHHQEDAATVARRFRARELRLVQNLAALAEGSAAFSASAAGGGGGAAASSSSSFFGSTDLAPLRCEEVPVPGGGSSS
jgi:pyridoxine kinase